MKTNNTTNNSDNIWIDSSLQFRALDEIVSMIQSLANMMNRNLPDQITHETAFAMGDLNKLVNNLQVELEMIKILQTKSSAKEMSDFVVSESGELKFENM